MRAWLLDVGEHPVIRSPLLWGEGAAHVAALSVEDLDVRVFLDHGQVARSCVLPISARGDRGADELDAEGFRALIVEVGLELVCPVVVYISGQDDRVGDVPLIDVPQNPVPGTEITVPGVHAVAFGV